MKVHVYQITHNQLDVSVKHIKEICVKMDIEEKNKHREWVVAGVLVKDREK